MGHAPVGKAEVGLATVTMPTAKRSTYRKFKGGFIVEFLMSAFGNVHCNMLTVDQGPVRAVSTLFIDNRSSVNPAHIWLLSTVVMYPDIDMAKHCHEKCGNGLE